MNMLIKTEEFVKFILAWWFSILLGYSWWIFIAWFLAPDIGILAYAINTKIGALFYNLFHHQGIAVIVGLTGFYFCNSEVMFTGAILFGHSAFDRAMGYGLKYHDDFKHTHLGWIGKK